MLSLTLLRTSGFSRSAALAAALGGACACDPPVEPPPPSSIGEVVWRVPGKGFDVRPAVDSSTAYFGSIDHKIVAVDRNSGVAKWTATTAQSGPFTFGANIVLAGDVAVLPDVDLYAYDRITGALRWMFRPTNLDQPGTGRLLAIGNTIYATSPAGRIWAIEAATGVPRWTTVVPLQQGVSTAVFHPRIHGGRLFVCIKRFSSLPTGALIAMDSANGSILWQHEFTAQDAGQGSGCVNEPQFHGDVVIASEEDGRIFALEQSTGAVRWSAPRVHNLPSESPPGPYNDHRPMVVVGDVLVAASDRPSLVGLNAATGVELWRNSSSKGAMADLATDEKYAYVLTAGLVVISPPTGATIWKSGSQFGTPGFISTPTIVGNRIYVAKEDGFYALKK